MTMTKVRRISQNPYQHIYQTIIQYFLHAYIMPFIAFRCYSI